jgi:hypothetical protein
MYVRAMGLGITRGSLDGSVNDEGGETEVNCRTRSIRSERERGRERDRTNREKGR